MIMTEIESPVNKYIDVYINNYVRQFRNFITSNYIVNIGGVAGFIATDDHDLSFLLRKLQTYGFEVTISNGQDTIDEIQVEYTIRGNANDELLVYKIETLYQLYICQVKREFPLLEYWLCKSFHRLYASQRPCIKLSFLT